MVIMGNVNDAKRDVAVWKAKHDGLRVQLQDHDDWRKRYEVIPPTHMLTFTDKFFKPLGLKNIFVNFCDSSTIISLINTFVGDLIVLCWHRCYWPSTTQFALLQLSTHRKKRTNVRYHFKHVSITSTTPCTSTFVLEICFLIIESLKII